ncbi:nucleotidyltransferase [Halobacteriovorax sp. HLS]|uniref:nucleotidyltransferase domain-containing protein n=1 Tax=Halobacteriovorax sp. HLS TaxID=2234000 RepID=UPI000FD80CA7|nr:nucleotidyltransferase [Halobacteriovorax sp. HLS]
MSIQSYFTKFHKEIKVETEELREKRDIIVDKIKASLKSDGHPVPTPLNQGSYIYGVGIKPLNDEEYDIDVGLDFNILSNDYKAAEVRKWVYEAINGHTKNVEDRGPCIRVRYAKGYHVDLVVYARHSNSQDIEDYQLAFKDNSWKNTAPKDLKKFISDARESFKDTKDSSGSDQLQRVTRFLKRWNDEAIPNESDDKPSGLATLLLVIESLKSPKFDNENLPSDIEALISVAEYVESKSYRVSIKKPTPEYEDIYAKINDAAMEKLIKRYGNLLTDLKKAKNLDDEDAALILSEQFGESFPTSLKKSNSDSNESIRVQVSDMNTAIPSFSKPARPHAKV